MAKQLTAAFVRTVNTPGKYHDEHGLILRVVLSERKQWISKSWVQRLVIHGRRRDLGLGAYPLVGLSHRTVMDPPETVWGPMQPLDGVWLDR